MALTGRGGPGRGQGMKPIYGETMEKFTLRLSHEHHAYLIERGLSQSLRTLLEWADLHPDFLVNNVPKTEKKKRTTAALREKQVEVAERIGFNTDTDGPFINGIRRVVETAVRLKLDPSNLPEEHPLAAKAP